MELQLVSSIQAKALKELGFPQLDIEPIDLYFVQNEWCVAPTLELAAKWLREEKGIIVLIEIEDDYGIEYIYKLYTVDKETNYMIFLTCGDRGEMLSYDKALSTGIDKAIEILNN